MDDSATRICFLASAIRTSFFFVIATHFFSLFLHNNVFVNLLKTIVSFSPSINKSVEPFVLVHNDVWGSSWVASLFGYRWFVSFIVDFSLTTWVYLLKDKSDVFSVFHMFHKMIQTRFNTSIKIVCLDNRGEYMSIDLGTHFCEHGIIHQSICVDTFQQNGIAEWKN